ncbi:hypothetical protein [Neotabrizicola sp. sgz301269]|uniref:hypothetical protein n=1 Tax=Neotabrizicola sp. sgz301269 TaxID=3276282 RepID=UPI00376FADE6
MSVLALLSKILFIGHSLVGPDLPGMVERGLAAMGETREVQAQIINGAPLGYNWDNAAKAEGVDGRAALALGTVGDLILTEAQPIAAHLQWSDTTGLVARWADAAEAANPEVRVWLYETWPSFTPKPEEVNADLPWRLRLDEEFPLWLAAAGDRAQIIPAGQAMALLSDEIAAGQVPGLTNISDVFADDIHLNGRGLYFVAMVQIAALTGRSPEGLPAKLVRVWETREAVIPEDQAAAFQRIAWAAVEGLPAKIAAMGKRADMAPGPDQSAAPASAPKSGFAPITNPSLTLGLAGIADWSVQLPFLDQMKSARPWIAHRGGGWGGWDEADLRAAGALDAEGWPLFLPDGVSGISTLVLTDLPQEAAGAAGRYLVRWQGKGVLKIEGRAQEVRAEGASATFDYTPGEGAVILTIAATDRADPIRHISIVREDRAAALEAGEIFNPDWLARIEGARGIRFMDWMLTNNSTLSRAADRPLPMDYSWARKGVPVEVMVALANRLEAEPWFTLPHLADDNFIRIYAGIVARDLDPGLRAWVELSNEVWNPQFAQNAWANQQGLARWGVDGAGWQYYGVRAAEVMGLWCAAMPCDRVVRVIATQTGWKGPEADMLAAPLEVARGGKAPVESFDAYAVTGYFSGFLGAEQKRATVNGWLAESEAAAKAGAAREGLTGRAAAEYLAAHRYDRAVALAAAELRDGSTSGTPEDTLAQLLGDTLPYQAQVAADHGLKLVMYEGGTHVVGYGPMVEDQALTDFFAVLNFSPEMGALYGTLLSGWARLSDQPFNAFVDLYPPNKWGSWGAMRHLGDENPRWLALARGCDPC